MLTDKIKFDGVDNWNKTLVLNQNFCEEGSFSRASDSK